MEPKPEFGTLLREGRKARGMTLAKLATETGFSRGTLSKLENGVYDRPPSERLIDAVSKALGIDKTLLMDARSAYIPAPIIDRDSTRAAKDERDRTIEAFYVAGSSSALLLLSDPPLDRTLAEAGYELVRAAQRGLDAHHPAAANTLLEIAKGISRSESDQGLSVASLEVEMMNALAKSRLMARQARLASQGNRPDLEHVESVTRIGLSLIKTTDRRHGADHLWFLVLKELASVAARLVHKVVAKPSTELVLSWPQVDELIFANAAPERCAVNPPPTASDADSAHEDVSLDEALIRRRMIAEAEVALTLFGAAVELEPIVAAKANHLRDALKQAHWEIERAIVMRDLIRLQSLLKSEGFSLNPPNQNTIGWCVDSMRQTILEVRQRARNLTNGEEVLEVRSFLAFAHLELGYLLRTREREHQDQLGSFLNLMLASRLDPLFEQYVRVQLKEIWAGLSGNNVEYVRLERQVERKLGATDIDRFEYDF